MLVAARPRGYMSITPKTQVVEENGTEPQARVTHCIGRSTYTLWGTTAIRCALSPARRNQESTGLRPSSSEAGPTGFRAFIIILPSTDKRERQSVNAASVPGLREWVVGAGARGGGSTPDGNCNANADNEEDSNDNPGDGSRTQAGFRC